MMKLIVENGSRGRKGIPADKQWQWWSFTHFWILQRIFARKNAEWDARRGVGGVGKYLSILRHTAHLFPVRLRSSIILEEWLYC